MSRHYRQSVLSHAGFSIVEVLLTLSVAVISAGILFGVYQLYLGINEDSVTGIQSPGEINTLSDT